MNRTVTASCLGLLWLCVTPVLLSQERAWKKDDSNSPSYFVPLGQQQWVEVHDNGTKIAFQETSRRGSSVELFDASRNLRIRLNAKFAELAVGEEVYRRWLGGSWVALDRLPEHARLAPLDYRLRLIYFVPRDRKPTANYEAKIRCLIAFVNSLYKYEFRRRGWDDRGFLFQVDKDQQPIIHLIRGQHEAAFYSGSPNYDVHRQYQRVQAEIPASIGSPATHLIVAFMETYDSGPHHYEWPGGVALGGRFSVNGGLGIFSAWILRDEFCATSVAEQTKLFHDETPIRGRTALGHGRPDSPRFEFIEDGFGAVMHEVGHALGLPHDMRDDMHYIMANGFRKLRVNFSQETPLAQRARFSDANAHMLHYSRYLNSKLDLDDSQPPQITVEIKSVADREITLEMKATDNKELGAYLIVDGGDGCVLAGDGLSGPQTSQKLTVTTRSDKTADQPLLRVIVSDRSGNHHQAHPATQSTGGGR